MNVVVCTNLSGKEPHREVGMGMVRVWGNQGSVMASRRGMKTHVVSKQAIFPIVINFTTICKAYETIYIPQAFMYVTDSYWSVHNWLSQTNTFLIDTCYFQAMRSALLQYGKGSLAQCQDKCENEWDIM